MRVLTGRPIAVLVKVVAVSLILAFLGMIAQSAFASGEGLISLYIAVGIILIAIVYFTNIAVPFKFFLPGVLFLVAFVVVPIVYTLLMSGFQFKTGNYVDKPVAIERIQDSAFVADESGVTYDVVIGKTSADELALLATDYMTNTYFIATEKEQTALSEDQVTLDPDLGIAVGAPGFTTLTLDELNAIEGDIASYKFAADGDYFLSLEGYEVAIPFKPVLTYNAETDSFTNIETKSVYVDNGRGNYQSLDNEEDLLSPGWRSPIWFENYLRLFTDSNVSGPFVSVFIWTLVFSVMTVFTQFALGLLIALALDKPLRGRRFYRIIIILPYAVPSIMSILVWGGMFDTEFGAINALLGTKIAWFLDPNFARAAVIIVNLWLGFPYFYLISNGALQAIPGELSEAATIDGAKGHQIFRLITLPLLLKMLTPLLIASFAFNFNNFNLIFLLTGGGPRDDLNGEIAGATDILISYTYKIAFGSQTQDLGLASAISVVIFILVAGISLYGIRKSKVLEEFI